MPWTQKAVTKKNSRRGNRPVARIYQVLTSQRKGRKRASRAKSRAVVVMTVIPSRAALMAIKASWVRRAWPMGSSPVSAARRASTFPARAQS